MFFNFPEFIPNEFQNLGVLIQFVICFTLDHDLTHYAYY